MPFENLKKNIDWKKVFENRNWIIKLIMNPNNPECISKDWELNYDEITYEQIINVD